MKKSYKIAQPTTQHFHLYFYDMRRSAENYREEMRGGIYYI